MKVVRLKSEELRAWRENRRHLVDSEGHLLTVLDPVLEQAIATVLRSAQSQRKSLEQRVAVGKPPRQTEHTITVRLERKGIDVADIVLHVTVDGQRIVTGREVVAAQMLQKHGECQLRAPNGVILKVVRDPAVHRPTFKESLQVAPRPEHCPCKAWGRPHPGTHYPTCPWNRLAPMDERAPDGRIDESEVRMLPSEALDALKERPLSPPPAAAPIAARVALDAVVVQAEALDPPENCRNGCLEWATPKGFPIPAGQHHPTCGFAKAWLIKTARDTPRWLINLATGERERMATQDEIGQGEVAAQRSGSPIIHIDDVPYAVVLETELDREAEEESTSPLPAPEPGVVTARETAA